MDFESFLLHWRTLKNASPQTIRAYRNDLKLFNDFAEARGVSDPGQIDHALIQGYIEFMRTQDNPRTGEKGLADASIGRRLSAVSSFLEYMRGTSAFELRNPVKEMSIKLKRTSEPKPVDEWDLDMLLASITSGRDKFLFSLLVASGFRVSEVRQLNRDSIRIEAELQPNGKHRVIGCGEVVGKGDKRRKFYVDASTLRIYATYLRTRKDKEPALFLSERGQRMSVRAIQERLAHWCEKIGFRHINVHRLRHTYATRLANNNIDSMVLMDLMGHNSFTTTRKYFKLTDTTLARGYFAAMEQIAK